MLSVSSIDKILNRLPALKLAVLGDLFLDRYLDIDAALTEPSLETGLDAYQVVSVRSSPGAAGTVINNLVAMGVGSVLPIAVIGDDGEGYELRQALGGMKGVDTSALFSDSSRRTPTYIKPMLHENRKPPRELNRLDIKNQSSLSPVAQAQVIEAVNQLWPQVDAVLVVDQVSEPECGVVTSKMRGELQNLGEADPEKLILADSRERIGMFRGVWLKPNRQECLQATGGTAIAHSALELARQAGRPVFCTCGAEGILVADPRPSPPSVQPIPSCRVEGPIDTVGAGDSTSAAIACAIVAGTSLVEAAAFGKLVASITIRQLGTTGTASPEQIRTSCGDKPCADTPH